MTGRSYTSPAARAVAGLRHSVRARLIVWNMLILAALVVALAAVTQQLMRTIILASVDRELSKRAQGLAERPDPSPADVPPDGAPPPPLRDQPEARPVRPGAAGPPRRPGSGDPTQPYSGFDRPQVLDLRAHVRLPSDMTAPWDAYAAIQAAHGQEVFSTVVVGGYPFRVASRPYPLQGKPAGVIQVPYPLTDVYRSIAGLNRALLSLVPVALLLAAAGAAFLANRALRPVRQIAQTAERIGSRDLSVRLPVAGKDEFWELAGVINGMLDRLQSLVERERQFTADASHELRTPLAIIKANTSLCLAGEPSAAHYRRSVEAIDQAADTMARLAQDLLLLARSDAGQLERHPITLLIVDVLQEAVRRVCAEDGPPVRVVVPDPALCVVGDEDELVRLFGNLLDNAVRYTPRGGSVTVTAEQRDGTVSVSVADTGAGIAPEHLPHLGERFYRVDTARSRPDGGTGLGLAIVKSIAAAHRGAVSFESTPGKGTVVRVALPVPPEQ